EEEDDERAARQQRQIDDGVDAPHAEGEQHAGDHAEDDGQGQVADDALRQAGDGQQADDDSGHDVGAYNFGERKAGEGGGYDEGAVHRHGDEQRLAEPDVEDDGEDGAHQGPHHEPGDDVFVRQSRG